MEKSGPLHEWGQRYVDRHGVPYLRLIAAAAQATVVTIRRTAIVKGSQSFRGIPFPQTTNLE